MEQSIRYYLAAGLFVLGGFVFAEPALAQLQEVRQTVYGMDCAPCAYAQENRLKAMDGIQTAEVSLNEGMATMHFAPENEITLEQIREAVRKSGFSPEEATLSLQGTLIEEDGQWILVTPAQERYRLEGGAEITSAAADQRATVTGTVREGERPDQGWILQVTTLDIQA
jgi:copper chaperone CopZ